MRVLKDGSSPHYLFSVSRSNSRYMTENPENAWQRLKHCKEEQGATVQHPAWYEVGSGGSKGVCVKVLG